MKKGIVAVPEALDDGGGELEGEVRGEFGFVGDELEKLFVGDFEGFDRGEADDAGGGLSGVEKIDFSEKLTRGNEVERDFFAVDGLVGLDFSGDDDEESVLKLAAFDEMNVGFVILLEEEEIKHFNEIRVEAPEKGHPANFGEGDRHKRSIFLDEGDAMFIP